MRNENKRSNERTHESADVAAAVRAGAAERFDKEQSALDRQHDRVRAAVDAQVTAAGADQSVLGQRAAQRLDALRADQTARLRENQSREKLVLDRQQSVPASPGNAVKSADQAMNEIRDLERSRNALIAAMAAEAASLRDGIIQDIQRNERLADQGPQAKPVAGPEARTERQSELSADRTAMVHAALNQDESNRRDVGSQQTQMADAERVADLNKRLENALERNRKQISAIEGVRDEADRERAVAATDSRQRTALERDVAALDQRLEAYRSRADKLKGVGNLIEQGRTDLAERFLDAVRLADGGRRRSTPQEEKQRDQQRVETLQQMQDSREATQRASQYAVLDRKFSELPPIKELWDRAAATAKESPAQLQGRELYEKAPTSPRLQ